MPTRVAAAAIAIVLALTVVGGAPTLARAHTPAVGSAVSCSSAQLPTAKGRPVHVTASLAGATALLEGTSGSAYFGVPRVLQPRLTISSAAHVITTFTPKQVPQTPGRGVLLDGVDAPGSGSPALCLAQFASGPVALLATTSAFNQCCFLLDTYAAGVRPRSVLQDGLVMPKLRIVHGQPVIVSADGSFLAMFTDYADSAAPMRMLTVRAGRQRDVTNDYPARLRREAKQFRARFDRRPARGLGYLAAWAADQERLGHDARIWRTLHELDSAGKLSGTAQWPHGQAFIRALKNFLAGHGYR